MDFERDWNIDAAADRQQALDPEIAAMAARVKSAPHQPGTMHTVMADANGVVILPAGTDINQIVVAGRNLVVSLPDGTQLVILEGAVAVPRLVVGDVEIPSVNLAALLIGEEPQPAAGPPRSSGGNFLADDGAIGDPFGLGDLLPPTELQFTQLEEREVLPIAPDEDDDNFPELEVPTSGSGTVVDESGLGIDNRPGETPGSNEPASVETTTGTITYVALDTPATITINGQVVTNPGQTIVGTNGTLTIISVAPGSVGYTYTVTDNTAGDDVTDNFTVTVTDADGDSVTKTLVINIIDDVPEAFDDVAQQGAEGAPVVIDAFVNDVFGADGVDIDNNPSARVTIVSGPAAGAVVYNPATGLFTFTPAPGQEGTASFVYQIEDGDGDTSQATVTITLQPDSTPTVEVDARADTVVDESALNPDGSQASSTAETAAGALIVTTGNDIVGSLVVNNVDVTNGGTVTGTYGTLTITGSPATGYSYSYTLETTSSGDDTEDSFTVTVTDSDGDPATTTLTIDIIDDVPQAIDDIGNIVTEDVAGSLSGNVLTNDVSGADTPKAFVAWGADAAAVAELNSYGTLTQNGDGSWSYVLDNSRAATQALGSGFSKDFTLNYTMEDADGDPSPATLTITVKGAADNASVVTAAATGPDATVYEAGLPSGTAHDGSHVTSGSFTVSATDGIANIVVGGTMFTLAQMQAFGTTNGVVNTGEGTLRLTGYNAGTGAVSYSYTLSATIDNDSKPGATLTEFDDGIALAVNGIGGTTGSDTLVVRIVDDAPQAIDDIGNIVTEDVAGSLSGNVLTNDVSGADTPKAFVAWGADAAAVAELNSYGTLTQNGDGSWSYVLDNSRAATQALGSGFSKDFTLNYTMEDADGDPSPATLTITVKGAADNASVVTAAATGPDATVYEAGLPSGTAHDGSHVTSGSFTVSATDGIANIVVGGTMFTLAQMQAFGTTNGVVNTGEGTLRLTGYNAGTGAVSYSYTLSATIDNDSKPGATLTEFDDSIALAVNGVGGTTGSDTLVVRIVDDAPILTVEGDTSVVEGATATGTWSQTVGADQPGDVTQVIFNGTPYALGTAINTGKGTLTVNADGSWTFVAAKNLDNGVGQSISFTVKVTDADNDVAQDAQTISITDGANPTSTKNAAIAVDEEALATAGATGTNPTSTAETSSDTVTFLAGSDNITSVGFTTVAGITADVNGVVGNDIVWSLDSATQITGKIGGITAITLTLTPSTLPITAGTSGSVTVSVTISDNFPHPDGTGQNQIVITGVTVTATDTDNDVATATAQVTVVDDVPVVFASSDILLSGTALSATGDFKYAIGADSRTAFAANNSDLQVTMSGLIGSIPTTNHQVTWVSEDAHSAVFNIAFDYDPDPTNASNPLTHETGTLTFDKDLGEYTLTLDQQIVGFSTVTTSQTISKESYNIVGQSESQPEIVVSKLADQFFVRFTGGEEASGPSVTFHDSGNNGVFSSGETFVGSQAWVSISGGANGVSSDTLQPGEVLDMNFYTSSPGNNANPGPGTATASGMYLKLDGLTGTEDMVVILKLTDPDDLTTTTRAIVVDASDIYKSSESNPYGITFADGSDGVIIIESNDYNFGSENYVITGAQLLTSTETVTGSNIAIDLDRATGASSGSTLNTESFGSATVDNDVIKISDIGIISSVTTTQVLKLDIDVTVKDADGDTTATTTLTLNGGVPPIALDLDGDGLEFLSLSAGVHHDYGAGLINTAWVAPDDGLLAHATGGTYDIVFSDDAPGAASDLEGLRLAYDSNRDGVFDAKDAAFGEFGVWQDRNSNGHVDAGEFKSLADSGIAEIELTSDGQSYQAAGGDVTVLGEATFVRTDGSKGTVGDVLFATASKDSDVAKSAESTTGGFNQALVAASLVAVAGAVDVVEQKAASATTDQQTATEAAPASTVTAEAETAVTETDDPASLASTTDQDSDQPIDQSSHGAEDPAPDHSGLADGGDAAPAATVDMADAAQPELGGHEALLAQSIDLPAFDGNAAVLAAVQETASATIAQVVSEALGTTDAPDIDALLAALPGVDHAPVLFNPVTPEAVDSGHLAAAAAVFDAAMAAHEAMAVAHG